MQIQVNDYFFQIGKKPKSLNPENLTTKSMDLVRDDKGAVAGAIPTYSLGSIDKYVDLVFQNNHRLQNLVFIYENIPEIQFPINYLTSRIINGKFTVKRWDNDTVVWSETATSPKDKIVGEKMKKFFSNPNPLQTFKELVKQYFTFKFLVGDAFIYAAGLPISKQLFEVCDNFWVLPAQSIEIDYGTTPVLFWSKRDYNVIRKFKLNSGYGRGEFDPKLVLHCKDFESLEIGSNYFYGKSRLTAHKYPVANLCAVYEARNVIYTKRGAIGAIVNEKKDADTFIPLTDPEKKDIRDEFNSTYGLEQKKDPVAIIDVPVKYINFAMSIQDLQPFEETLADASVIAGAYNIDSVLIPRKDQSTFNNLKEAEAKVYTSTIIPEAVDFCEKLSQFLGLNEFGYYIDVCYDHVEVLADALIKKETAKRSITERCKVEFNAGIISINDWRAALGKERIENTIFNKTLLEMTDTEVQFIKTKIQ